MTNNQVAYLRLQEERRSNLAKEGETARHNKEQERQTRIMNSWGIVDTAFGRVQGATQNASKSILGALKLLI